MPVRLPSQLIDSLHKHKAVTGKNPCTYRSQARRAYLGISKHKRPGSKLIRKGIRQQLQYLRRDFKHIEQMLDIVMPEGGMVLPLNHRLQRQYWIIQHLYAQQQELYKSKTKRCDDRIISIS